MQGAVLKKIYTVGKLPTLAAMSQAVEGDQLKAQTTGSQALTVPSPAVEGETNQAQSVDRSHAFTVCALSEHHVSGSIDNVPVKFLVDTGAAVTVVRKDVWDEISHRHKTKTLEATCKRLIGVQCVALTVLEVTNVTVVLSGEEFQTEVIVADTLSSGAIIGRDFLQRNKCVIDLEQNALKFKQHGITLLLNTESGSQQIARIAVTLDHSLDIPSSSELETMVKVPAAARGKTWIVEPNPEEKITGIVARAVVSPKDGRTPIRLINPGDERITIKKGTTIAMMEPLEGNNPIVASLEEQKKVDSCSETKRAMLWEIADTTSGDLTNREKECFDTLLLEYSDIFAEDRNDYGRTDIVQHRICTGDKPPIRQQVRRLPPSRRAEVQQLLREMSEKKVIQPLNSPWASPIVRSVRKMVQRGFAWTIGK